MRAKQRVATKLLAASCLAALLAACAAPLQQHAGEMAITRSSDMRTVEGPSEYFTGRVTITGQFQRPDPSRVGGAIVHFEPGARTAWHTHPVGQTLIVTEGVGWTQVEGGQVFGFSAGDILWCPPDHKHWHGATPTTAMTHIAIQEAEGGSPVTWMEHVTDDEYLAGPANAELSSREENT